MAVAQKSLKKDAEAYARLTAAQHITSSHFSKHQKIEGYFENREAPDFVGSDSLLKIDTLFGTIQLGYNPRRGQSFLFANIKTSIYDNAASRYQRELKEYQMMRGLKTGTQNTAYVARRRGGSATVVYKAENTLWSRQSIAPYLRRLNMETLRKTMPFLDKSGELADRDSAAREQRRLRQELAGSMAKRQYAQMSAIRAQATALESRQNELNALLYRKDTQRLLFFRRINAAMGMQQREMFAYYRDARRGGSAAKKDAGPVENKHPEVKDD